VTIDAQQIENTAALLHRLTPHQTPIAALRAVAVLRDVADTDVAQATVTIATTLHASAARRAVAHAPQTRFDADQIRVHVTRHWHLHCYLDHLQTATRSRQPQTATDAVERQIALTLDTRTIHPLVSDAAMTLSTLGGHHRDRFAAETGLHTAGDPRLPIMEGPPEEAARLMFHHPTQLHGPFVRGTEETSTSSSRPPGLSEPVTHPVGRTGPRLT
jgi:hypothetical protein